MIDNLELRDFSAFRSLKIDFSSKINVIIGANGTGKTQLLKAAYALCAGDNTLKSGDDIKQEDIETELSKQLTSLFMPHDGNLSTMRRQGDGSNQICLLARFSSGSTVELSFSNHLKKVRLDNITHFKQKRPNPVFIPTQEVLEFMKGLVGLCRQSEFAFDQTYQDICLMLDLPPVRKEHLSESARRAMDALEAICGGHFVFYDGGKVTFKSSDDGAEFSVNTIAEGFRKAGMFSRLLEIGTIRPGVSGPLFWDEPEGYMNPELMEVLVRILLDLSRNGQQIILTTHDYVLLKWLDLLKTPDDQIRFHSLYRDNSTNEITISSCDKYALIEHNAISDTYAELYDEAVKRALVAQS